MVFIYCLACPDTVWYVGKTKNPKARERHHRDPNENKGVGASLIPSHITWELIVLDEVDDNLGADAERFYYEFLNPILNKLVPGRNKAEYYQDYRDSILKKHKERYEANKEVINERRKLRRANKRNSNPSHLLA